MSLTVSSVLSWAQSSHSDSDFVRNSGPFIQRPLQTNASAVTSSLGISYSFIKILFSWTDTVAAVNSNLGVVVSFKGARRDLPTRNEQWIWPWVSTKQRYDTAPEATWEASQKWWVWVVCTAESFVGLARDYTESYVTIWLVDNDKWWHPLCRAHNLFDILMFKLFQLGFHFGTAM